MVENIDEKIYAYALENAHSYGGKANEQAILSHLFKDGLKKEDIKGVMPKIKAFVKKVNSLKPKELEGEFSNYKKDFDKLKELKTQEDKVRELPELPNAVIGKVVTRIPPEPSKYIHLGHAVSFLLNYVYAKRYEGKCLLRFEDTNPEKVSEEFVNSIIEDLKWLGIEVDGTRYVSDDMKILYEMAENLIRKGRAFMCFCDRDKLQNYRHEGKECECRNSGEGNNMEEWKKFLEGKYLGGEAILRLKGDMKHLNHTLRDPVIFRAVKAKHYRQGTKYKVWPMYDFYNPIEDSLMDVTHILRSNEFEQRTEIQDLIKDLLNLKKQTAVHYGRFNVEGTTTKGREIRELIESGEYIGWDDPRLVTIKALRRRGITKEAIHELVKSFGLNKYEVYFQFEMIASINRKIIDPTSSRYYFVQNPKKITISDLPSSMNMIEVPIHPDKTDLRKIKVSPVIYVSDEDFKENKGKEVRLLHLFNINLKEKTNYLDSVNKGVQKIQWVSDKFKVKTKILMPDGNWVEGFAEKNIEKLKVGEVIQFERFGFCRFDRKKGTSYEFWFTHK